MYDTVKRINEWKQNVQWMVKNCKGFNANVLYNHYKAELPPLPQDEYEKQIKWLTTTLHY